MGVGPAGAVTSEVPPVAKAASQPSRVKACGWTREAVGVYPGVIEISRAGPNAQEHTARAQL